MQNEQNANNKQNETNFPVENNFSVNATKGAQVLALVFVIGAAVFTNGDQTAIAANAPVQPHNSTLISTPPPPPPPPPPSNLKARKGAYYAFKGHSRANTFAGFYKQRQIELFSALDNALSQKAEETLTEFAAVKKADIQLQTPLGNRQAQIGINIMGAFAESQNSAFGWQVRAFGGENNIGGANAGVFFRRIDGETLYGINSFADYEDNRYGEFLRYGIGGELQNPFAALAINYYLPITDDKRSNGKVAFSQKGIDVNLRVNIPQLDGLKLRGDYYQFDGKYGGEDDKGFRYGFAVQPIDDLRIGVFYDDGGEEFGGDIVYVYNFGIPQKRESKVAFSPDLFSPVVREYSQRIMTAQLGPQLRFITTAISVMTATIITPERVFTTPMTMAGMTATMFPTSITMSATRAASVQLTVRHHFGGIRIVITTSIRFLITLPPAPVNRPLGLTLTRNLHFGSPVGIITESNDSVGSQRVGTNIDFGNLVETYTLTVVEGSEEFVSVPITLTMTTKMTTADVITETPMTIAGMTTTTRLTFFATSTIGAEITTGAAKVDSHFPPSFPPSFPQVPKIALAENQRPQLSFPPPPTRGQATAGINSPQGGECCGASRPPIIIPALSGGNDNCLMAIIRQSVI